MERVLTYLVALTPKQVLFRAWALLFCAFALNGIRPLSGVASAIAVVVLVGYSYVVILGTASRPQL